MLKKLKVSKEQCIVITDGSKGAYAFEGEHLYLCPPFDSPVVSTLGASTLCGALQRTNLNLPKSLMYASVNSASVVSKFGATQGLLTYEQIEERLRNNPNYKCMEI